MHEPTLEDFKEKEISMIISKNENSNLISKEIEDPEGLKPYQWKWLANKDRVEEERWTMRLNSAWWRNISPEHLLGFKLQINEEDDMSSKDDP